MSEKAGTKSYWRENTMALAKTALGMRPRRPGVFFTLDGDWICDFLKVDFREYYTDCGFQIECRRKASAAAREALGMKLPWYVDFGTVFDVSVYGAEITYRQEAPPSNEPVIASAADIPGLIERMDGTRDLLGQGLVPRFFEWRDTIKKETGNGVAAGFAIKGPATMAGQICGMNEVMMYLVTNPDEMAELVKLIGRTTIRLARQLRRRLRMPAVSLSMANDLAGLVSPDMYRKFFQPVERRIYAALCPVARMRHYHADSRMKHQIENLRPLNLGMVNFGPDLTVAEILEKLPDATIFGHVPPTAVLWNGTPEQVLESAVANIRDAYAAGGRIVVSSAGSVNPGTPFENLLALMQAPLKYLETTS